MLLTLKILREWVLCLRNGPGTVYSHQQNYVRHQRFRLDIPRVRTRKALRVRTPSIEPIPPPELLKAAYQALRVPRQRPNTERETNVSARIIQSRENQTACNKIYRHGELYGGLSVPTRGHGTARAEGSNIDGFSNVDIDDCRLSLVSCINRFTSQ